MIHNYKTLVSPRINTIPVKFPRHIQNLVDSGSWSLATAVNYLSAANNSHPKLSVELLSPLPPDRSGISDFTQKCLPFWELLFNIRIVHPSIQNSDVAKQSNTEIVRPENTGRPQKYAVRLIHLGNSPYHTWMHGMDHRGINCVLVIHDVYIGHERRHALGNNISDLIKLYTRENGAINLPRMDASISELSDSLVDGHPFLKEALSAIKPKAIIVHSYFAANLLSRFTNNEYTPGKNLFHIPLPRQLSLIKYPSLDSLKGYKDRSSSFNRENQYIVCLGNVTEKKMILEIIEGYLESDFKRSGGRLVFVGQIYEDEYQAKIQKCLGEASAQAQVQFTGYSDQHTYNMMLRNAFMAIQLRKCTRGESSAALADCAGHLVPLIVNSHGSFAEEDQSSMFMLPEVPSKDDIRWAIDQFHYSSALRALSQRRLYHNNNLRTVKSYTEKTARICELVA
jgi:glycosyltransferase involved in cell wall biosynthesis